jgi:hypothetical protein
MRHIERKLRARSMRDWDATGFYDERTPDDDLDCVVARLLEGTCNSGLVLFCERQKL